MTHYQKRFLFFPTSACDNLKLYVKEPVHRLYSECAPNVSLSNHVLTTLAQRMMTNHQSLVREENFVLSNACYFEFMQKERKNILKIKRMATALPVHFLYAHAFPILEQVCALCVIVKLVLLIAGSR